MRIRRPPAPTLPSPTRATSGAVPSARPARAAVVSDGMDPQATRAATNVVSAPRPDYFAQARDGFLSFDPSTKEVVDGHAAGVALRDGELQGSRFENLLKVFARGVPDGDAVFTIGAEKVNPNGTTNGKGLQSLPLDAMKNALSGLDAKRGGLLDIGLAAKNSEPGRARMLALPQDYDGPIFISDIDETLRMTKYSKVLNGEVQPPIEGAEEILAGVAKLGAPIIYLSAGAPNIRPANEKFLSQFPPGVLLNQDDYPLENLAPDNGLRTKLQADYKSSMLAELRKAYPHAKIFGLGDDKYGDAIAYANAGATAYIHNVDPTQKNLPADFKGVVTDVYSKDFVAKVLGDVAASVKQSTSFGGDPKADVVIPIAPPNPEPMPERSLLDKLKGTASDLVALGRPVPSALTRAISDRLKGGEETLASVSRMTDAELKELPADSLAAMAEALLTNGILAGLARNKIDSDAASAQVLRLVTAHGTDIGEVDRISSRINRNLGDKLTGPARESWLRLHYEQRALPGDWSGFDQYLDAATQSVARTGSTVTPLIDGDAAFGRMLEAIDSAKKSVSLSVFSFRSDQAGWDFARKLADAADRGCQVRVLYDRLGSTKTSGTRTDPSIYAFLRQHGVEVIQNAPAAMGDDLNHRKLTVIDGEVGFAGGMNIGDEWRYEWHDVHSELHGPVVADLQRLFIEQWKREGGKLSPETERALIVDVAPAQQNAVAARVVGHDGEDDRDLKLAYLRAIDTAQKEIRIASPYFTDPDLVDHLTAAAQRGVRVDLVLPKTNDKAYIQFAEKALYDELRRGGVRIYEYKGRPMAHEKVATFDGRVTTIGSSNLDARSLHTNDESNVWIQDEALAAKVNAELFDRDLQQSDEVKKYKPGILHLAVENLEKRLSGIL